MIPMELVTIHTEPKPIREGREALGLGLGKEALHASNEGVRPGTL